MDKLTMGPGKDPFYEEEYKPERILKADQGYRIEIFDVFNNIIIDMFIISKYNELVYAILGDNSRKNDKMYMHRGTSRESSETLFNPNPSYLPPSDSSFLGKHGFHINKRDLAYFNMVLNNFKDV